METSDEDPYIDRSYRRTVGRLNIPGFRKGKAPRSIVENYVGRTALVQEALDFMIPETLNQVLQEQEIQAFVEPRVEVMELEPVTFNATVPLEPTVDLGDFYNVRLEKEEVEISDDEVDRVLDRIRREMAPWEPVSRPVQFGDLLNVNVKGEMDGEEVVNDQEVDYIPETTNVLPFPGFADHLEGLEEGSQKDFTVTIPEDYPRPEYAGKDVAFSVEVLTIKERALADLDDDFAKGVGDGFDDMEALRAHILERITGEAESQASYAFQEQSMNSLLESATITASDILLEREVQNMQDERERMLRNQRLDLDTYLSYVGKSQEEFQEELRPMAEDRLNRMLVVRKLAQEEELDVTPEEIEEEIETMLAGATAENETAMRRALNAEGTRESIRGSLLNQKVMARLVEIVQGLEPGALAEQAEEESEQEMETETEAAAELETVEEAPDGPVNEADASDNEGA
ncbi:Trigger factor [Geodia barretti]|uniref:peptidylprolyl isomerase n=1 Tax=Geodia barretti TaxID=519541 RepID=A0AA35SFC4_GEOBA|nr:Trigger factor [Geodia barretti]